MLLVSIMLLLAISELHDRKYVVLGDLMDVLEFGAKLLHTIPRPLSSIWPNSLLQKTQGSCISLGVPLTL